jgi:predicted Fe-Mo cluster-binding NifX family protein
MKIAVTCIGKTKDSKIDTRFGRCSDISIFSEDGELIESIPNPGAQARRGAGVRAAQKLVDEEVKILITGNIGPNALNLLQQSNIKVFIAPAGIKAKEAFEKYQDGELNEAQEATGPPRKGRGPGGGAGQGRGRGRNN